ncbi:hypothetical protein HHI36_003662 [Cryptolaemus montrouzieri]|uniref:Uncharacterized protein n=1 Tax=Cryptolaemus montrouzieri TaxID=559131 RepID=A0ABD2PE28_9CUCU
MTSWGNIGLVEANMNENMCINLSSELNEWIDQDVTWPSLTENNQGKLDSIQQLTISSHIVKDVEIQVSPAECDFLDYLKVEELQKRNQKLEDDLIRKEVLRRSTERDLLEMDGNVKKLLKDMKGLKLENDKIHIRLKRKQRKETKITQNVISIHDDTSCSSELIGNPTQAGVELSIENKLRTYENMNERTQKEMTSCSSELSTI